MHLKWLAAALLASSVLTTTSSAQQAPKSEPAQAQTTSPMKHTGDWRASKLIGVNVYNPQNEMIGDINEILLDPAGKVSGVVIGVGGFLGMGEHDVLVKMDQIKFVNEPIRAAATSSTAKPVPANTTGTGASVTTTRPARTANEKWYPDHAVMNTTKDQLKALPQFKYSNYN